MYTRDSKTTVCGRQSHSPAQRRLGTGAQGNKLRAGAQGCQALAVPTMPQHTLQAGSFTAHAIALRTCVAHFHCVLTLRTADNVHARHWDYSFVCMFLRGTWHACGSLGSRVAHLSHQCPPRYKGSVAMRVRCVVNCTVIQNIV